MAETKKRRTYSGVVTVCLHRVSFWYDIEGVRLTKTLKEVLTEEAEERAKHCINEGYHSGELNCLYRDEEIRGWWSIQGDEEE